MGALLLIAARNLVQARRRTGLVATALALVTLLMTLLLALSQGLSETLLVSATTLATGHVNIGGFYKVTPRDATPVVLQARDLVDTVRHTLADLDHVVTRGRGWGKVVSQAGSLQAGITGIDLANEPELLERLQVFAGDARQLAQPGTALIFAAQAKRLKVRVGDMLTLSFETFTGQRNTGDVRVAAIARDMGLLSNWSVLVANESLRRFFGFKPDTTGAVLVYLRDIRRAPQAMEELRAALTAAGYTVMDHEASPFWMKFDRVGSEDWVGQRLDLTTWDDELTFLRWVVTALNTLAALLAAVLLVIIGIGFMNTMWIAVRERTAEIGTLRAIGMSRRRVLAMFLVEAVLLGLLATGAGALAGALAAWALDAARLPVPWEAVRAILMSDVLHLVVKPGQITAAIATFTAVMALAALWPAARAARLPPVTAIAHVT